MEGREVSAGAPAPATGNPPPRIRSTSTDN